MRGSRRISRAQRAAFSLVALVCMQAQVVAASTADLEFFEKSIRPILLERCYECHGAEKQKGALRLDSRATVLKGGDSGPALEPGKPEGSLLFKAVSYQDPDFQMPPKNPLSPKEIAALREWIARGAPDPREETPLKKPDRAATKESHWAYQPIRRSPPPPARDSGWSRSEIDQFIFAKVEQAGLSPVADADRATLLRRVYFDLIGLPPSPEEIAAFTGDKSAEAYRKVVDRLLESPRFGERWARHWLDVARYAESVTLRGLVFKEAWRYRDYVIEAFNRDMPFDHFVREQIAGDLLKCENIEEAQRAQVATTYLVIGNHNYEEQDKEQLRMDIVDEQLDTIGKGLLAQTIGCARCHDHKFDPIPTRDYYAMAGILRNTRSVEHANVSAWLEVSMQLPSELEARLKDKESRIAQLQKEIKAKTDALAGLSSGAGSKESTPVDELPGIVVDDAAAERVGIWQASQHYKPYVGRGYIHDENSGKGSKTVTFHPPLKKAGKYEVRLAYTAGDNRASNVPVTILHATGETTLHVNQKQRPALGRHFVSLGQFEFEAGNQGYVLVSTEGTDGHVIADAVQFLSSEPEAGTKIAATVNSAAAEKVKREIESLRLDLKRLTESEPRRPLVMSVKEEAKIEDARVHIRGSVHNLGSEVARGFLAAASFGNDPEMPRAESGRRQLADWITSTNNPLTARVFVNRAWLWLFGAGIVRTPDNFGTTGEKPTHPELLDYLAARFMEENWSVKKLVRELVLTRTYQLASAGESALAQNDPENRLFARASRRRLEAECLRDAILSVSGKLKLDAGGPTIKSGTAADFGYLDQENRRSIYVPAFRNALPQIFQLFDFADPSVVTGERSASVVAPQALFFLNHPFVLENSRSAAERLIASGSPESRIDRACLLTFGRPASSHEQRVLGDHLIRAQALGLTEADAWTDLFQGLFASMNFRYLD